MFLRLVEYLPIFFIFRKGIIMTQQLIDKGFDLDSVAADFTKMLALDAMNIELSEEHDATLDVLHNWICDLDDSTVFEGIVSQKKSIQGCIDYCSETARKNAQKGATSAMIYKDTVFGWCYEFFTNPDIEEKSKPSRVKIKVTAAEVASSNSSDISTKSKKKSSATVQKNQPESLDMFSDMDCDFSVKNQDMLKESGE